MLLLGLLRFKFEYLPVVAAALTMSLANVYGYTRCSSSAHKRLNSLVGEGLRNTTLAALQNNTVASWMLSKFLNSTPTESSERPSSSAV